MPDGRKKIRVAVLAGLLWLSGCASYDDPYYVHSVWRPIDGRDSRLDVFYITDREVSPGMPGGFSYLPAAQPSCGVLDADIPAARLPTEPGSFGKTGARRAFSCGPDLSDLADRMVEAAHKAGCSRILIFVHGFYTGFETAVLRTAQLKSDAQFACPAIAFSWASAGKSSAYYDDLSECKKAEPLLAALVRGLAAHRIQPQIVAHSMGALLTLDGLASLAGEPHPAGVNLVGELMLYAADVDVRPGADEFLRLAKAVEPLVGRITIYASAEDAPLMLSARLNGGARLGREPVADRRFESSGRHGVDVINASDAPGDPLGHNYYGLSYEALSDMALTLAGVRALERTRPQFGRAATLVCGSGGTDCGPGSALALNVSQARKPDLFIRLLRWILPRLPDLD